MFFFCFLLCGGQNFLSKINKVMVNYCDGCWNRILLCVFFDVYCVQIVQEYFLCKRSCYLVIGKGLGFFVLVVMLVVISYCVGFYDLLIYLYLFQDIFCYQGVWGYLVYVVLFIIVILCLIFGSLLVIVGGMFFGLLIGFLFLFVVVIFVFLLLFLIVCWFGCDLLQCYVGYIIVFQVIECGIVCSGCDFLIFICLVLFFFYNIQNYVYGLMVICFWFFILILVVIILLGLVIYLVMVSELVCEGVIFVFVLKLSFVGGLLFVLVQIGKWFVCVCCVVVCSEEVCYDLI